MEKSYTYSINSFALGLFSGTIVEAQIKSGLLVDQWASTEKVWLMGLFKKNHINNIKNTFVYLISKHDWTLKYFYS